MPLYSNNIKISKCCITYFIDSSPISKIIDAEASQNPSMKKETVINAIQKVLMRECESDVNSTSSTITIPGTPPAYSTAVSCLF